MRGPRSYSLLALLLLLLFPLALARGGGAPSRTARCRARPQGGGALQAAQLYFFPPWTHRAWPPHPSLQNLHCRPTCSATQGGTVQSDRPPATPRQSVCAPELSVCFPLSVDINIRGTTCMKRGSLRRSRVHYPVTTPKFGPNPYYLAMSSSSQLAVCLLAAGAHATFVTANDPSVRWVGRKLLMPNNGYAVDWEGAAAKLTVTNATFLTATIADNSRKGARFAVYFNNTASTSANTADAAPNLLVGRLLTSAGSGTYPLVTGRGSTVEETITVTLQLLTEPAFIGDASPEETLTIAGFETDGVVGPAPPASARRIEYLGDSLTAGYGSGFDFPAGAVACGAGTMINDVANSYGAQLCNAFGADCQWEAVSGVTLEEGGEGLGGLPSQWPFVLGSMTSSGWANATVLQDFGAWVPQAIVINLGENDWPKPRGGVTGFTAAYVAFVETIVASYAVPVSQIVFFATIGPHEKGQSEGIIPAVSQLAAAGYTISFLNATVQEDLYPKGCGGHPGPSVHKAMAARAQPVLAEVMGWA
jgi:hypothetical protein